MPDLMAYLMACTPTVARNSSMAGRGQGHENPWAGEQAEVKGRHILSSG